MSKLQASLRKLDLWPVTKETKGYRLFKVDTFFLVNTIQKKLLPKIGRHLKVKTLLMHYFPSKDSCPYIFNLLFVHPSDHISNSMIKHNH